MDTKVCSKCGKELPLERFETVMLDVRNSGMLTLLNIEKNPLKDRRSKLNGYIP